jgi:hypothetical protein
MLLLALAYLMSGEKEFYTAPPTSMSRVNDIRARCEQIWKAYGLSVPQFNIVFASDSKAYRYGLPFTENRNIVLRPDFFEYDDAGAIELILHEMAHIYQRYNRDATDRFLAAIGFIPYDGTMTPLPRGVDNPDVRGTYMYRDISEQAGVAPNVAHDDAYWIYNSRYDPNITTYMAKTRVGTRNAIWQDASARDFKCDITNGSHPYEIMAEILPRIMLSTGYVRPDWLSALRDWVG